MVLSSPFYLNYIQYQSPNNDWEVRTQNVYYTSEEPSPCFRFEI